SALRAPLRSRPPERPAADPARSRRYRHPAGSSARYAAAPGSRVPAGAAAPENPRPPASYQRPRAGARRPALDDAALLADRHHLGEAVDADIFGKEPVQH